MKRWLLLLAASRVLAAHPDSTNSVIIEAHSTPPVVAPLFAATSDETIQLARNMILADARIQVRVVQGHPESVVLGLTGEGEVLSVTGAGLESWALRQGAGGVGERRELVLQIAPNAQAHGCDVTMRIRKRLPALPADAALPLVGSGGAVGFEGRIHLQRDAALAWAPGVSSGLSALGSGGKASSDEFLSQGAATLTGRIALLAGAPAAIELVQARLEGHVQPGKTAGVAFRLIGKIDVREPGARFTLLSGKVALSGATAGDGWHCEWERSRDSGYAYVLVGDRAGSLAIELPFIAKVEDDSGWSRLRFRLAAGAVVPMSLAGIPSSVAFRISDAVVPNAEPQGLWLGYLPADGDASIAWRQSDQEAIAAVSFASSERTELRIGAGRLEQTSDLRIRLLQGKLAELAIGLEGSGEIVAVDSPNVLSWNVRAAASGRELDVRFSRPLEGESNLTVSAQSDLGAWPTRTGPLRLLPRGAVRHSGLLRVSTWGAVRLEVTAERGVMQLAPDQFEGAPRPSDARQVLVYRFPAAGYGLDITANPIRPEVDVSAVVAYRVAAATRGIDADLELDVREAPLRDWSMRIPAGYTVVAATGPGVGDYAVESAATDGTRALRWLFDRDVEGRVLLQLRLERSQPPAAGEWLLPRLTFPAARTVRGQVGVICSGGYRVAALRASGLAELPVSLFSHQEAGLQQAWRVREPGWSAAVALQALAQSVQAEVFHLYSVREGVVHGSVLISYFVVGAPATEWRVAVPEALGNVDVVAQSARREWRRVGGELVVPLHEPVLGASTLLVTFDEPMGDRGGVVAPGEVRPLGVQSERGYVQVVSPLQLRTTVRRADGALLHLEPEELPAELRLLAGSPSLAAYQYTARPFALEFAVAPMPAEALAGQLVEFAHLTTRISVDGQAATSARLVVKSRGQPALRLGLPPGTRLWDVRVDGGTVTPRADDGGIVVPLGAHANPNQATSVEVRYGQPARGAGRNVELAAPRVFGAPILAADWTLRGDPDRRLAPRGGDLEATRPPLTETGFEWIGWRGALSSFTILALLGAGIWWWRQAGGPAAGLLVCSLGMAAAAAQALSADLLRRPNLATLTYATSMVAANQAVKLSVANTSVAGAMADPAGVAAALGGAAVLAAALLRRDRRLAAAGAALLGVGLLAQHGGALLFFGALALAGAVGTAFSAAAVWRESRRRKTAESEPALGAAGALVPAVVGLLALLAAPRARAAEPFPAPPGLIAESVTQHWSVREGRAIAEAELRVRGRAGDSLEFLRAPAALTGFDSSDLRASPEGELGYRMTALRDGVLEARVRFELPLGPAHRLPIPTTPAARQTLTIELDQDGWDFSCPQAVEIVPAAVPAGRGSAATLILEPGGPAAIEWLPRRRDTSADKPRFLAESSDLFVPGPGGVSGTARITVRPVQGRIGRLVVSVPAGLTVGEVTGAGVGAWTFDPSAGTLSVAMEPARTDRFAITVETQLGEPAMPYALQLRPLRVIGAASDTGMLAVAFGGDAQSVDLDARGLFPIDLADFPESVPGAHVQAAWRFAGAEAALRLGVAAVAPEVRASGRELVSLSDDRVLVDGEVRATITRAGVFRLSLQLPDALDVESLSGSALNQWTETTEGGRRVALLELTGRTTGEQSFHYTLVGQAPKLEGQWNVPSVRLREADRQTGELIVVPDKGLGVHATAQDQVQAVDPRELGGLQPGTLAFQLLDRNWTVRLGIERLQPWITAQALEEWTLREGQTLARIGIHYRVENAAIRRLRVRLPGMDEAEARTVRASGPAVNEIARVPGAGDLWEIALSRAVAGEGDAQIEFQTAAQAEGGRQSLRPVQLPDARHCARYVAVRSGGRLDVTGTGPSAGWPQVDWSAVPAAIRNPADHSAPALSFRVGDDDGPLVIAVARREAAAEVKLRVTAARLTTLVAAGGASAMVVELDAAIADKSRQGVRLPPGAQLAGIWVNGEAMAVAREGDWDRFQVSPAGLQGCRTAIRIAYLMPGTKGSLIALEAPGFGVPLENVTWKVYVPAGYALAGHSGGFRLEEVQEAGFRGLEAFRADAAAAQAVENENAKSLLERAGALLQSGDQQGAGDLLVHVSNSLALDPATNEDARVELRQLKTDQAMLGLNTVRQRLYLDNQAAALHNEQLERAVRLNPFMRGGLNYNPRQMDQLLMGNSLEQNSELRGIAGRLVDQQLDDDRAAGAIDLALPERGQALTFARALEVDGNQPLRLDLALRANAKAPGWSVVACLAAIFGLAGLVGRREKSGRMPLPRYCRSGGMERTRDAI